MSPISPLPRRGDGTDDDARRAMDQGAKTETARGVVRDDGDANDGDADAMRGTEEAVEADRARSAALALGLGTSPSSRAEG